MVSVPSFLLLKANKKEINIYHKRLDPQLGHYLYMEKRKTKKKKKLCKQIANAGRIRVSLKFC